MWQNDIRQKIEIPHRLRSQSEILLEDPLCQRLAVEKKLLINKLDGLTYRHYFLPIILFYLGYDQPSAVFLYNEEWLVSL